MSLVKTLQRIVAIHLFGLALVGSPAAAADSVRILVVGSPNSHTPGEHDFGDGVLLLKQLLLGAAGSDGPDKAIVVDAHPYSWPDEAALRGASTVVLYLDGDVRHPLLDPQRRAQMEGLVKRGVGLVTLHQASTVPKGDTSIPLRDWLGGVRHGLANRTTQTTHLQPVTAHPTLNGVAAFDLFDEFYPEIDFAASRVPLLAGRMQPQFVEGKPVVLPDQEAVVAWAATRADGGRSVSFTGGHFLISLDSPSVRKFLLNSVFWTAGLTVPANGFTSRLEADAAGQLAYPGRGLPPVTGPVVTPAGEGTHAAYPWGDMQWLVSGAQRSSGSMTQGLMTLRPGGDTGRHYHPNADVVLHVLSGQVRQVLDDKSVALNAGDTISIPQGVAHHSINTGSDPATVMVSFPSAWHRTDTESAGAAQP